MELNRSEDFVNKLCNKMPRQRMTEERGRNCKKSGKSKKKKSQKKVSSKA